MRADALESVVMESVCIYAVFFVVFLVFLMFGGRTVCMFKMDIWWGRNECGGLIEWRAVGLMVRIHPSHG